MSEQKPLEPRYGWLTVVRELPHEPRQPKRVLCRCACGEDARPKRAGLVAGKVKSCGCKRSLLFARRRIRLGAPFVAVGPLTHKEDLA